MNKNFCLSRLGALIRNDIILNLTNTLITAGTIAGGLLVWNFIDPANVYTINQYPIGFIWILFIGGVLTTGNAFKELRQPTTACAWLTLPASVFEKYLSRLLLTSVIYFAATLALYTLIYWIIAAVAKLVTDFSFPWFNPLQPAMFKALMNYMIIHALFFLGAIYFKRYAIIKTILTITIFNIAITAFMFLVGKWVLSSYISDRLILIPSIRWESLNKLPLITFVFWLAIMLVCWVVSYFRLKEVEA
jgi:hypothetical protein